MAAACKSEGAAEGRCEGNSAAPERSVGTIEDMVVATLAACEQEGIETNLHEAKTTSGGYLSVADMQGKLHVLLERHKPRDYYDFYFLLRTDLLSEKKRDVFEAVLALLQKEEANFDGELRRFLPKGHQLIIRDFKTTLEREIKRYI